MQKAVSVSVSSTINHIAANDVDGTVESLPTSCQMSTTSILNIFSTLKCIIQDEVLKLGVGNCFKTLSMGVLLAGGGGFSRQQACHGLSYKAPCFKVNIF